MGNGTIKEGWVVWMSGGLRGGFNVRLVVAERVGFWGTVATASREELGVVCSSQLSGWVLARASSELVVIDPPLQPPTPKTWRPPPTDNCDIGASERTRDKRTSPRNCRGDKGSGDIPGGESGDGGDGLAGALERERRSVVRPEIRQLTTDGGRAIATYRSSGEGREHLGSLYGAQLAGTEMRCQVAAGRGQKRGGGRIC